MPSSVPPPLSAPAAAYAAFRKEHLPAPLVLREPAEFHDPIPVSERLVQAIWASRLFRPENLRTTDNRPLKVLDPGRWNGEGGPDFRGARILLDGVLLQGDVELHLYSTGWKDHRHAQNPAYNHVILDVCLWDFGSSEPLLTTEGRAVPQLALSENLDCPLSELVESLDPDRYPFPPNRLPERPSPLLRLPREELASYVESAGDFRFQRKCNRFREQIAAFGAREAACQALAETLGYRHNKEAFAAIARSVSAAALATCFSDEARIECLLRAASTQPIRRTGIRPANHPERRLAALAILLGRHSDPAVWFRELAEQTGNLLQPPALIHSFWSWHWHRRSPRLAKPIALVGPARWREIMANAVLPFSAAWAVLEENDALRDRCHERFRELPAAGSNTLTRRMAYDLGLPAPSTGRQEQGLIQLYTDFEFLLPDAPPKAA